MICALCVLSMYVIVAHVCALRVCALRVCVKGPINLLNGDKFWEILVGYCRQVRTKNLDY